MEPLALLEKYFEEAKKRGARPELLRKMENQISRLQMEKEHLPKDNDRFELMFKKATDEIEKRYLKGTIDYIIENYGSLYKRINRAWKRLDEVWIAGRKGNATIEEFREVLKEWYLLNIKAIEIYKRLALNIKTES